MATRITPPLPAQLSRGVHNDPYTIKSDASGTSKSSATSLARRRAYRAADNFRRAIAALWAHAPGGIGFSPRVIQEKVRTSTHGSAIYVRATFTIYLRVLYAIR